MWGILFIALLRLGHCFVSGACRVPASANEVDWSKMGGGWYDVMAMPRHNTGVDLYDWHGINVTDSGIRVRIEQSTCGNPKIETFILEFIRVRSGVYVMSPESKQDFIRSTMKSNRQKDCKCKYTAVIDDIFSWEWIFETDYESYFFFWTCTGNGWSSFAKARNPHIDLATLVKIWNAYAAIEVTGHITLAHEECRIGAV